MPVADQVSSLCAKRRFPFYRRAYLVPRTYIRGNAITQLAELLITTVIASARCVLPPPVGKTNWKISGTWYIRM